MIKNRAGGGGAAGPPGVAGEEVERGGVTVDVREGRHNQYGRARTCSLVN